MRLFLAFFLLSSIGWAQYIGNGPPPTSCIGAGQPFYVDQTAKPPALYFPSNGSGSSSAPACKWVQFQSGTAGPPGPKGDPGSNGKDGKDGVDGQAGADGAPGKNGLDGKDGMNGANGKDGNPGAAGPPVDFTKLSSICAGSSCPPAVTGALVLPLTDAPATSTSTTCTFVVHLVAGVPTRYMSCLGKQEVPF